MLITSFDKPIVFRVSDQLKDSVELIIRKWVEIDNIDKTRNQFYLDEFYENCFPLIWPKLYVVCIKWTSPCCPYREYKTSNKKNYWISIDKQSNLNDFDALLSLQFKSSQKNEIVKDEELAKNQLIEGKENLTIISL